VAIVKYNQAAESTWQQDKKLVFLAHVDIIAALAREVVV